MATPKVTVISVLKPLPQSVQKVKSSPSHITRQRTPGSSLSQPDWLFITVPPVKLLHTRSKPASGSSHFIHP